jgi:hypothetical protein
MASRALVALGLLGAVALIYGCGGNSSSDSGPVASAGNASSNAGANTSNGGAANSDTGGDTASAATSSGGSSGSTEPSDAGTGGAVDPIVGPKSCSDETEVGAPTPSAGARTIKSGTTSPGKSAALIGFSATNVDTASNALLWARYSGAATFRSFGSVPPNPSTIFTDGITTQAAFTKACLALASSPSTSPLVDLKYISDYILGNPNQVADVLAMADALAAPMVLEIKTTVKAVPLLAPPDSATDWQHQWEVWKNYFAVSFVYARDYGVSRFEIYNEPDLNQPETAYAYSSPADYAIRARLAGDAIQQGIKAANAQRAVTNAGAMPLVPVVIAPTTTVAKTQNDYGNVLTAELHDGPLGTPVAGYSLFEAYGYHNYGGDGAAAFSNIQALNAAVLKPKMLTLPWYVTEFNAECTGCEQDNITAHPAQFPDGQQTYVGDLPDFSRRLSEKAIAYAESAVGPMNLYAFNFLSLEDDTTKPPTYANNGLYWATDKSVVGGDSLAGAAYRLSLEHFGGARDLLDLGTNAAGSVEGVYDARYDAYFILASNGASTAAKVFFDLSSLALPAGSLATVIDVDAQHHGEVTHRISLSTKSSFELTQQANAVTLISIPRSAGTIVGLGAIADTTLAPGSQSGARFGADTTLQLAADSTNTAKLRTALLAFQMPDLKGDQIGEALLELALAPGSTPSPDVIHVYGVADTGWTDDAQTGERWSDMTNLRAVTDKSPYAQITDNAVQFSKNGTLDPDLRVAGTAITSPAGLLRVDVTDYLREQAALHHDRVSLLVVREVNRHLETIAYSAAFRSRESDCGAPSLTMRLFK